MPGMFENLPRGMVEYARRTDNEDGREASEAVAVAGLEAARF